MTRWGILLVALILVTCLALGGTVNWAISSSCSNPAFLTRRSLGLAHPIPDFDAIVQVSGGLPRSNAAFDDSSYSFPNFLRLAPVSGWRISSVRASTDEPIHQRVVDDDPTYLLAIELEVDYADGTQGVLRWSRWQYGLLLCPFVVPYGDGPPWVVERVEDR